MQDKMYRILSRLLQVPGFESNDVVKCNADYDARHIQLIYLDVGVDYIMVEDALRQAAEHKDRLIEDDLTQYMLLCDRLQTEHVAIPYAFASRVLTELVSEVPLLPRYFF